MTEHWPVFIFVCIWVIGGMWTGHTEVTSDAWKKHADQDREVEVAAVGFILFAMMIYWPIVLIGRSYVDDRGGHR